MLKKKKRDMLNMLTHPGSPQKLFFKLWALLNSNIGISFLNSLDFCSGQSYHQQKQMCIPSSMIFILINVLMLNLVCLLFPE